MNRDVPLRVVIAVLTIVAYFHPGSATAYADDSRAVHALERIATALEKTCR